MQNIHKPSIDQTVSKKLVQHPWQWRGFQLKFGEYKIDYGSQDWEFVYDLQTKVQHVVRSIRL